MSGTDDECPDHREAATGDFCLTEEQAAALELDHNVAITAGAGTGKTTALTERYLAILEEHPGIGPEQIVTITFTNDAANELRTRIRDAVGDRLSTADAREYEQWRTVKDDLDDGYLHTIHGFCARILRENIVDAPVTPEFEVYDETDATVLAREITREELNERLVDTTTDVSLLARLWNRDTLEDILVSLIQQRPESDVWAEKWHDKSPQEYVDYIWETIHPITPEFADDVFARSDVQEAFRTIRSLEADGVLGDISPAEDDGADTITTIGTLVDEYTPLSDDASTRSRQQCLDELCGYLTTNDGTRHGHDWTYWGSATRWEQAGREDEQQRLESAVETLFDVIDPGSLDFGVDADRASAHYVLALARVFDGVREAYEQAKREQNVLDYDDLVETTIRFLRNSPSVRDHLRERFEYVMVDEVQDTDPRQWGLVKLLTSEDPDAFDAQNVFLVGDEKQSIYRFRGADVTSFSDARRELAPANPDGVMTNRELTGNFRTVNETLTFCNELFDGDRVFDAFGDVYEAYEARPQSLTTERDEANQVKGESEYLVVPDDNYDALHAPGYLDETPQFTENGDREAYAVAARLTQLFADPPQVHDEDDDEIRAAKPEDVTILLRSRTRLKSYERALNEFDIPYTVVSGTGYYDTPEISALLNLLRVLENPRDEIALYGVLRSPLFGIEDDELARLRLSESDLWTGLSNIVENSRSDRLADAYNTLQRWRRVAGVHSEVDAESTTPWGTLLSQIIEETGFLASVAGDERTRQAVVNVNRFREQVRRWEEAGVKSIAELRTRLELRQDIETHADEATIPEDADGVQVRTIHSAKGLEFPIVVVPELGTQFNFGTDIDERGKVLFDELNVGEESGQHPVIGLKSPTPTDAFADEQTLARRVIRERVRQHERAELKRLLYVAATRARDHIILSGIHELEPDGNEYRLAEANDPAEATCWRDWVQPLLLDADTLNLLANQDVVKESLGESEYHITRPVPPNVDWQDTLRDTTPSLSIDLPSPLKQTRPFVLTATDYASQRTGADDPYLEGGEPTSGQTADTGLSPTTLGTIVHRIAETRLQQSQWEQFVRDVAKREGETVDRGDLNRVETYTRRALGFIDEYESDRKIISTHDELSVSARFDNGRIVGDIDHLIVTSDAFHVIDYKTNNLSDRSIDSLARYYWPQLEAYAVALSQADPTRDIELVLYFTDAAEPKLRSYDLEQLTSLEETIETNLDDFEQR